MSKEIKRLKPPLTYYGGKQTLAPFIISLIPEHTLYAEPFTGGGAVFFNKSPSEVEVLNDTNGELMNFYKVLKEKFSPLQKMVKRTLHCRNAYRQAEVIYNHPDLFDEVRRAWAIWVLSTQSFASSLTGSFGFDKIKATTSNKIANKRDDFLSHYAERLKAVQIECADALYIIQSRDFEAAFFYCDPPYIGSNMGHYKGYTEADYEALLQMLEQIKGKFLLSSYPSALLSRYIASNGWMHMQKEINVTVNQKSGNPKKKTELLVANYPVTAGDGFK